MDALLLQYPNSRIFIRNIWVENLESKITGLLRALFHPFRITQTITLSALSFLWSAETPSRENNFSRFQTPSVWKLCKVIFNKGVFPTARWQQKEGHLADRKRFRQARDEINWDFIFKGTGWTLFSRSDIWPKRPWHRCLNEVLIYHGRPVSAW